ncbi:MAG: type II toxin-antitoxin system HicA family toxin [Oscillospiraceae bacterium]|nr:type II toxin-antitoxin system HicA family toxin [Oscillospiraceae bacterium]
MAEYEKAVRKILRENGCSFVRNGKGDHSIWHSPITNKNFPVDGKIKSRHIANAIMRQSGVRYKF